MDVLLSTFANNKEIESNNDKRTKYLISGYIRNLSNLKNIVIPNEIKILLILFYRLQEEFQKTMFFDPERQNKNLEINDEKNIISNNNGEFRHRGTPESYNYVYGKIICESPFKYKWIFEIIDTPNNNDRFPEIKIGIKFIKPYRFRKNRTGINNHLLSTLIGYRFHGRGGWVANYIQDPNPGGYSDIIREDILSKSKLDPPQKGDKIEMNLDLKKYKLSFNINGKKIKKPVNVMKNHKYKLWIEFNHYTLKLLYFTETR